MTGSTIALLLLALSVGIVIGVVAATLVEIGKRQAPASGKLSVQYRGPLDVGPCDLPYWSGDRK